MIKKWFAKVVLVMVGVLLALLLSEGLLRVTGLASGSEGVFTVSESDFQRVPGIWEPGQSQVVRDKPALPHRVTTNDLGYRGPEFPLEKPESETRILYVGDSFTFGSYVDDDETMPARVQAYLGRTCGLVQVVNGGLGGSTITEHRPLIERGLVTNPDLIVLQFSENDVTDLANVTMWDQLAEDRRAKSGFPLGAVYPVLRRTAIWGLVLRARAEQARRAVASTISAPPEGVEDAQSQAHREALVLELRERYATLLAELRASLGPEAPPLVFVAYPSHLTLYGKTSADQIEWVTRTAEEVGFPTVDLRPPLAATGEGDQDLYLLPHDGHPSARGYDVAADYLAASLLRDSPLAPLCDRVETGE